MGMRFLTMTALGMLVLSGCFKVDLKTVVLKPSQVATATKRNYHKHEDAGVNCAPKRDLSCYDHYGVLPDATGDSPVAVGLWHDYADADWLGLVGCWERINCIYRGLVMFDLTQLGPSPTVAIAKLKYQGTFDKHSDATQWSAEEDCIAKIGYLLSPWGGFDVPAEFYTGDISQKGFSEGINVSIQVRDWVDGKTPNHGFILVGPKEATGKNDDDTCVAKLGSLRLEVRVNVAGN